MVQENDGELRGTILEDSGRSTLGGDEKAGQVLSGVSFEGYSDGNLEGVVTGESDPLGIS